MPGGRLRLTLRGIEERFQLLDASQERMSEKRKKFDRQQNRNATVARQQQADGDGDSNGAGSPHQQDMGSGSAAVDAAVIDAGTSRVRAGVSRATEVERERVSATIAADIGKFRARAARTLAEQRAVEELCSGGGPAAAAPFEAELRTGVAEGSSMPTTPMPGRSKFHDEYATFVTERGGHERFEPLFSEDDPSDRAKQAKAIARLISTGDDEEESPARGGATGASPGARGSGNAAAKAARGPSERSAATNFRSASRSRRNEGGGGTTTMSPYANPNPPNMRAMLSQRQRRPQTAGATPSAAEVRGPGSSKFAEQFFKQLPPVIPVKSGVKHLAQRMHARPSTAGPDLGRAEQGRASTPVGSRSINDSATAMSVGSTMTAGARAVLNHFNADDAIFTKEFYFLHVKLVHTQARLTGWEFSVTITDVTDPERLLRHTFKHLRVNDSMHIVFKPPGQIFLSPVDDIPWVSAPEALFMHTLRIEVYSTHPSRSKVVDSMVFFGDVVPGEEIASKSRPQPSAPSSSRPPAVRDTATTPPTSPSAHASGGSVARPGSASVASNPRTPIVRPRSGPGSRPGTASSGLRASGEAGSAAQLQAQWPQQGMRLS